MQLIEVIVILGFGSALVAAKDPPVWPDQYFVQGTLQLPYAEITEPFTACFDGKNDRSHISYYANMPVTIQLGANGTKNASTTSYKITYMTNDIKNLFNVLTCFKMDGTPLEPVGPQSMLPDLKGFKLLSEKGDLPECNDSCDIWQMTETKFNRKNVYTMWVTAKDNMPVRYEMMGYDTLIGSHYDKYYLDYNTDSYKTGNTSIAEKYFDPKTYVKTNCSGFPGPGDAEHRIIMNPMAEYIHNDDHHIDQMFKHFKVRHSKNYRDEIEHEERKHTFRQNVRFIHSKNRASLPYRLAVNHLTDRTDGELRMMQGYRHTAGYNGGKPQPQVSYKQLKQVPDVMDWRLYGAVTQVKDQATCGSCWSFGTSGAVEGAHFLKTGELVRLSQQALMDCSWGEGNNACDGGEDFRAYEWILKHGLPTEDSYGPYLGADGYCHYNDSTVTVGTKMTGYVNVTNSVDGMRVALALNGPISVAIDASHKSLSFYSNGVYYEKECKNGPDELDHAVLAVGYGYMNGQGYWLIKNSWSTYWGNDGYVLMAQKDNNCGVTTAATYPLV